MVGYLNDVLPLPEHGRSIQLHSVLARAEVGGVQEDVSSLPENHYSFSLGVGESHLTTISAASHFTDSFTHSTFIEESPLEQKYDSFQRRKSFFITFFVQRKKLLIINKMRKKFRKKLT